ncbi:MAG TPA: MBL fold metallo-hydrolase [Clostridiales bacterium]|nr:MBL fold metallo-hydrolase [Clostridiales bacterium]
MKNIIFRQLTCWCIIIFTVLFSGGCSFIQTEINTYSADTPDVPFKMYVIDVGQGDSILLECDKKYMLVDAGDTTEGENVVSFLHSVGVTALDYVVITHPHADHYGGMKAVLSDFTPNKIVMPDAVQTTRTWETLLDYISDKNINVTQPRVGDTYTLGSGIITAIAPNNNKYDSLNNYSVVLRAVYGNNSFLLTGDAEAVSEKEILKNGYILSSDVLKVGHHGSNTSTTKKFLQAVNPQFAVISVGKDNDYGHPSDKIVQRLNDEQVEVYRTDEQGTIVASSDGEDITMSTLK